MQIAGMKQRRITREVLADSQEMKSIVITTTINQRLTRGIY